MLENQFAPLPEHNPPAGLSPKSRQELTSHTTSRLIWGEGNPQAPIFVVLDNPGAREDAQGRPFLCGSRQTLLKAASQAGFNSKELYVSYLLKARPLKKYDKRKARAISKKYLDEQINVHRPLLLFCLGNVVVKTYFQDPEAEVKKLRGKTHLIGGLPTLVSYHPLGVRRRPNLYPSFSQDWALARSLFLEHAR